MFGDLSAYIQGLYPVKHIELGHFIRARLSFVITYWTVLASVESCCVNAFHCQTLLSKECCLTKNQQPSFICDLWIAWTKFSRISKRYIYTNSLYLPTVYIYQQYISTNSIYLLTVYIYQQYIPTNSIYIPTVYI